MQDILFRLALIALFSFAIPFSQQLEKPRISNITTLPSEPILAGNCKSSTAGYLEMPSRRTDLTDAEIGHSISKALKDGYIITVYPKTKRGIFVNYECPLAEPGTPKTP